MRGRSYALAQDMTDIAADVLRHRVVLSYEGLTQGLTPEQVVGMVLQHLPPPAQPLQTQRAA
jgi:MoxR-like ATPase